jgi:hypothetical protein
LVSLAVAAIASQAHALCVHNGVLYAKTSLGQEFAESRWVVRARVEGGYYFGQPTSWSLYHLQLLHAFKGHPLGRFDFYTRRDSGGFYLDTPRGRPDVGHDYLLFLNPGQTSSEDPAFARSSTWVNYECGQSKPWAEVSADQRIKLSTLEKQEGRLR